ncbi:MAG: bifunctional nuclease family protein [Angustibacter sp.]
MRELEVVGVRVELPNNQPIVLLKETGGDLYLPIWIGAAEATAIAYAQQGVVPPRPLTHDLFKDVLEALGHHLEEVRIVDVRDGVFYAVLAFDGGVEVSSRTSDAIALALRTGTRIVGADAVLEDEGLPVPDEQEDEVERFREFLDQISAEDFESAGPTSEEGPGTASPGGDTPER